MKRKVLRNEAHETILNLIDLGFTAPAVTYMLNRSGPAIYHHLKRAGRMKGRKIIRKQPDLYNPAVQAAMRKVFDNPRVNYLGLRALALAAIAK